MEKEISKKSALGFLRFISIPLIFGKGDKRKNRVRICKCTFLIFENGDKQKNCVRFSKICKYAFLNIWKRGSAKKLC